QSKIEATLRSAAGQERQVEIISKILPPEHAISTRGDIRMVWEREHKRIEPQAVSLDDDVLVAKVPLFAFNEDDVGKLIGVARKHNSVILDLRGNAYGSVESLRLLVSGFFDHEVKIADVVAHDSTKLLSAKPDHHTFSGKLTVLVDSRSTGAAEL